MSLDTNPVTGRKSYPMFLNRAEEHRGCRMKDPVILYGMPGCPLGFLRLR